MRIAIVTPRYGLDMGGGAENQARGFAEEAVRRGWTVEVWTTCAASHYTWENELPVGRAVLNGAPVQRFPIDRWDRQNRARLDTRLSLRRALPKAEQDAWLATGPHSTPLYRHVARHAAQFDVLVMLPYTNPLVHYAAQVAPGRTVIWPCLHDEAYAYLEPVRLLLETVWAVMFNSPEEEDLAISLLQISPPRHTVLGEGVALPQPAAAPAQSHDTLLYVGRLEEGKNVRELYRFVQRAYDADHRTRLAVVGSGPLLPPQHPAFDYRGFVSDDEKAAAYAAGLALCQPSLNESFSLVTMESWLAGRPVLVHADCAVTRGHVMRSKGGLAYSEGDEFVAAVQWLRDHPELARRMGENGRRYVQANYTWPAVVDRFARIIARWQGNGGAA